MIGVGDDYDDDDGMESLYRVIMITPHCCGLFDSWDCDVMLMMGRANTSQQSPVYYNYCSKFPFICPRFLG